MTYMPSENRDTKALHALHGDQSWQGSDKRIVGDIPAIEESKKEGSKFY